MKKILVLAVLIVFNLSFSQSKEQKIRTMMDMTGGGQMGVTFATYLLEDYKKAYPEVPDKFWQEFVNELKPDELVTKIIPVYSKHFTEREIDELIAFYKTPVGAKLIGKLPVIQQESALIGERWGQELASKIIERMNAKQQFQ